MKKAYIDMKNRTHILLSVFLILSSLFSGFHKSLSAQNSVDMSGQKIEWMIERKTFTRAEMQAILDKPANERFISLKVMVKLPAAFSGTNPVMASSMFDFTIYDPKTGNPSIDVANHIASESAISGLYFGSGFKRYKIGGGSMGRLDVVPSLEIEPCGGIGISAPDYMDANNVLINDGISFDTLFEYPVYINSVGSFDICFSPCNPSTCAGYPLPAGQKCPGTYGLIANFVRLMTGVPISNSSSGRNDFFQISNGAGGGIYEPLVNGENTYNRVICGGALELS